MSDYLTSLVLRMDENYPTAAPVLNQTFGMQDPVSEQTPHKTDPMPRLRAMHPEQAGAQGLHSQSDPSPQTAPLKKKLENPADG